MKKNIFLIGFLLCSITALSQTSIIGTLDNSLLQKYIRLAKQNYPRVKIYDAQVEKAKNMFTTAKMSAFDILNAGYYYRPENVDGIAVVPGNPGNVNGNQIVTRGFQAGVAVNLGSLFSKPSVIKSAKADYALAKAQDEEYEMMLETEVKSKYYDFLLMKKHLEIRNLAYQNSKIEGADAKTKYERGDISIEAYNSSKSMATESEALVLAAEVNYLKAKNALEDMIGTKLENVH